MNIRYLIIVLETIGIVNALYLTITVFKPRLMISWFNYRGRQKRIADLGYHVLPLPCMWLGKAVDRRNGRTWCECHSYNIPTALLGEVLYISLMCVTVFENHGAHWGVSPLWLGWAVAFFGVLFSARMMYLMFVIIPRLVGLPASQVWCVFCVISASTMSVVWLLDSVRLFF